MKSISAEIIGVIHSPFKESKDTPVQSMAGRGVKGRIEIFTQFSEGLRDLDGFSHIYLIYYFDRIKNTSLITIPFLDTEKRGVYATRAPVRPNHIGLSIVRITEIKDNNIYIEDLDILDQTPLLDIKPYIEKADNRKTDKEGWLEGKNNRFSNTLDDERFI